MADNTDNLSPSNFGIMNTMEMGMGNQEMLNDLFSPETASGQPEDLTPIIKEVEKDKPTPALEVSKGKVISPVEETDDEKTKQQSAITNFLGDTEKEEEEIPEKVDTKESENLENNIAEDSQFTALANDLFKLGVFNKNEEEDDDAPITTPEQFLERFNVEKKRGAQEIVQNFIGQFGEDYQNAFEAIYVKGADPKEYFGAYNNVVSFAEMDLTLEKNQEAVVRQSLINQGYENDDVENKIEKLKNYGDLEEEAQRSHKVLVKKEAAKLADIETQAEQALIQKTATKNSYINNVQNILQEKLKAKEFDGIPVNPKLVNELQEFLLVDKWKLPSGELLSDFDRTILDLKRPENHQMKVKVGLILKMLEKDPTLSSIQRTGITKKTDTLFSEVARQVTKDKTKTPTPETKSWFNQL